jgi:hypothetical protein
LIALADVRNAVALFADSRLAQSNMLPLTMTQAGGPQAPALIQAVLGDWR